MSKNKTITIIFTLLLTLLSSSYSQTNWKSEVEYSGALKNAMQKGDISTKMDLSKLKNRENLYGIGALGNLKGEIQIFNSEPFNTFVDGEKNMVFDKSYKKSATLIVYTQVKKWKEIKIPNSIQTRNQFEQFLEKAAKENGLDTEKPFPFLINGVVKENDWHIIDWDEKEKKHSHKKHRESGLYGTMNDSDLEMIGFFSKHHKAIFTHHTTYMHIHYKTKDGKNAGHSDGFVLGDNMILKLPME